MKAIIFIFIILFSDLFGVNNTSIIDSIKKENIETVWTEADGYFISNIKLPPNSVIRESEEIIFVKSKYDGYLINKETGNIYQRIWQSLFGQKDQGGYPYDIELGNWDMLPIDTSKIYIGEYETDGINYNKIIAYKGSNIDTLYRWKNDRDTFHRHLNGSYYFYLIDTNSFLVQYDVFEVDTYVEVRRKISKFVNSDLDTIYNLKRVNLGAISFNNSFSNFVTTYDSKKSTYQPEIDQEQFSYDLYNYNNGISNHSFYLDLDIGSRFAKFINDTLVIFKFLDSLEIYNSHTKQKFGTYHLAIASQVRGIYYDDEFGVANIIYVTSEGKQILSIHIPSKKVVLDRSIDVPYLGMPISTLNDGTILSIGDDTFVYKHTKEVFDYDSLNVKFSYVNQIDGVVNFIDESFGAVTVWKWEFGDGTSSDNQNPTHTYSSSAEYEVKLHIIDFFGNQKSITKTIKVEDKVSADFSLSTNIGAAPLEVNCINKSSSNVVRYIWNFGDGHYSYEESPVHTYKRVGQYSISLTVFDGNGNFETKLSKPISVTK